MKLYYCTDCKRHYHPGPDGVSGPYLSKEELLAELLVGRDIPPIRCDPCMEVAVEKLREERKEQNQQRRWVECSRGES